MPENKHASISAELEKAIRSGKYFERLPPVRALAEEYNVSLQTMSKALKTLQNSGLIASGPGGTRIMPRIPCRRNTGVVTLFMLSDPRLDAAQDPLLTTLREEAARDDVTLVLMSVASSEIFKKASFWETPQSDGYIFLYSSFYPVLSRHLTISGIPYVVGNWLPDDFNAHWVDFDWKKRIFDLVKLLIDRGYKRIAYMPQIRYDFGIDFHLDLWQDVCSSYDLINYSPDRSYFSQSPQDQLRTIAQSDPEAPEVVIPTNTDPFKLLQTLDYLQLPSRLAVSRFEYDVPLENDRFICYKHGDYTNLARKLWQVFKQVSDGTAGNCYAHFTGAEPIIFLN